MHIIEEFDNYTKQFDLKDECIKEKYDHSYHVYGFGEAIMAAEGFSEYETKLGLIACMYHDIGRFYQWTNYHTYMDADSIDHASLSAEIFKKEIAPKLSLNEEDINTIFDAIYYHNKFDVSNVGGISKKILSLVRDADKIEIMNRMYITTLDNPMDPIPTSYDKVIPQNIVDDTLGGRMLSNKDIITPCLRTVRHLSWINDINFNSTIQMIVDLDIFNRKYELVRSHENEQNLRIIQDYVDQKINERIDIKADFFYEIKQKFNQFVYQYDLNDENIKNKFEHSYRVMANCKRIAGELNLNENDTNLAILIGILHDIGRFEQVTIYKSFKDHQTIDHAALGCKILFEQGLIKEFWPNESDYDLIKFAIGNHNKVAITETDNDRFLLFAKIIRDADKLDIVYLWGILKEYHIVIENESVTPKVLDDFKKNISINRVDVKNPSDDIVLTYSFVFDLNFIESMKRMKEYLYNYYCRVNIYHQFDEIHKVAINYLEKRINLC
ncbi:MAG: HD domain-containing protein [Bacilli bacterium]|nr:HD domain-containing protein [Bacilli bacterium]